MNAKQNKKMYVVRKTNNFYTGTFCAPPRYQYLDDFEILHDIFGYPERVFFWVTKKSEGKKMTKQIAQKMIDMLNDARPTTYYLSYGEYSSPDYEIVSVK